MSVFFKKIYPALLAIVALSIILVVGASSLEFVKEEPNQFYCGVVDPIPLCGTTNSNPKSPMAPEGQVVIFEQGQALFDANCKQCHAFSEIVVGPALKGVTKRRNKEWLHKFIRNPQKVIQSGDTAAVKLYNQYKQYMPNHAFLSDEEIDSIIEYMSY